MSYWRLFGVRMSTLLASTALFVACGGGAGGAQTTPPPPPSTFGIQLQQVASGLMSPVFLTAPSGDARLFIVEQPGRIRILKNGALTGVPFLDVSARISSSGERGLLSMAFDPNYATNGFFFVYFTVPNGDIAIERFSRSSVNADLADPASALRILTISHSNFSNHNGGQLSFGPDGFLYAGIGDGGGSGDPSGNGQNTNVLLGKMLRLDVRSASLTDPYASPAGNPFIGQAGKRSEIWATGLRNPWRFAFDGVQLYVADVGQDSREEVNIAAASAAGLNYGWKVMEGTQCYGAGTCNMTGLTLPVLEYEHGAGGVNGCSITGGYVYRGSAMPEVQGRYFYSDYCGGWLKSFALRDGAAAERTTWPVANVGHILSFGEDAQRELYVLTDSGVVYRLVKS